MRLLVIIIFNHKFDKNIAKLEQIYGTRFSNILYLVPYYEGNREDVVRVFGNSYYFHSYIVQSAPRILEGGYTHFLFLGDDVLLHPAVNEGNVLAELGLASEERPQGYIKQLASLNSELFVWEHAARAAREFYLCQGINFQTEIPSADEARRLVQRHSIKTKNRREHWSSIHWKRVIKDFPSIAYTALRRKNPDYPLVGSYSDIFLVEESRVSEFIRLLSVFAGMNLWVEFSIPTALALACDSLSQEENIRMKGCEFWWTDRSSSLDEKYGCSLERLYAEFFTENTLYVHPVKLSKWE